MSWSKGGIAAITDTKKTVLKKKVILNIIIESYSWYDRIFRYLHMALALFAPLISFIDQMITGSVENTSTAVLVLGSIVAGMIKLKDYLKFDKLKDQSKQQTVKYQQLFQRIEREMRKADNIRQNEEEFISWITRELLIIEVDDPDLPQSLKEKYIKLCKERGIPYDEDLEALGELFSAKIQVVVEPIVDKIVDAHVQSAVPLNSVNQVQLVSQIPPNPIPPNQIPPNQTPSFGQPMSPRQAKQLTANQPARSPTARKYKPTRSTRTPSDEADRLEYREKIKTLDTSKDLDWAIERLNNLN